MNKSDENRVMKAVDWVEKQMKLEEERKPKVQAKDIKLQKPDKTPIQIKREKASALKNESSKKEEVTDK